MNKRKSHAMGWLNATLVRSPRRAIAYSMISSQNDQIELIPLRHLVAGCWTQTNRHREINEAPFHVTVFPDRQVAHVNPGTRCSVPSTFEPIQEVPSGDEIDNNTEETRIRNIDYQSEIMSYGNPLKHTCCIIFTLAYVILTCIIIVLAYKLLSNDN